MWFRNVLLLNKDEKIEGKKIFNTTGQIRSLLMGSPIMENNKAIGFVYKVCYNRNDGNYYGIIYIEDTHATSNKIKISEYKILEDKVIGEKFKTNGFLFYIKFI